MLTVAADLRARIAMKTDVVDDKVNVVVQDGAIVIKGTVRSTTVRSTTVRSTEDMEGIRELFD